jgi:2,3-bisphosphoglycerate-independent phosphoglycerate mutase
MDIPLIVLGIIDGFGYSPQVIGNAITAAKTTNLDYLWTYFPHYLLKAAEEEVGLAFGEIGNSEVGHIAIGTGRVVPQNLSLINRTIDDGSYFQNPVFIRGINYAKEHHSTLHIMGIISTSGVHGHLNHILSLIKLASSQRLENVSLHLILDGRDSGPRDTPYFLRDIETVINQTNTGVISTISGRAFTMDRNNNWEITQKAYNLLIGKADNIFNTVNDALNAFYQQGLDDENIPPSLISNNRQPPKTLKNNDVIIFTNFREDRARQITKALCLPDFKEFERGEFPSELQVITMTQYEAGLPVAVAYPPPDIPNTLSDILSTNLIPQIHIAESEKYAHVTYFFNGGREIKRNQEEYYMVPSLKPDEFASHPQMSAQGVTQAVLQAIELGYKFIVFNFANCDMVGHTGNYEATIKAVETVDNCFGSIWEKVDLRQGYLLITADHGNSEQKINPKTNAIYKEHTTSPVPFIIAHNGLQTPNPVNSRVLSNTPVTGLLSDIAPTILSIAHLPIPAEMTGTSLF